MKYLSNIAVSVFLLLFVQGCGNQQISTTAQGVIAIDLGDQVATLEIESAELSSDENSKNGFIGFCESANDLGEKSLRIQIKKQSTDMENWIESFEITLTSEKTLIKTKIGERYYQSKSSEECHVFVQGTKDLSSTEAIEILVECMLFGKDEKAYLSMADLRIEGCN